MKHPKTTKFYAALALISCLVCTADAKREKRDPAVVIAEIKRLQTAFSHDSTTLDLTSVCESVETARNELAKTDKLTPEQEKLLNPVRVAKRMNKILSRVAPVAEKQKQINAATTRAPAGQNDMQSPVDTLDELPDTTQNSQTKRNCPLGGVARLSSYAICELRESFLEGQESRLAMQEEYLAPTLSVVEENNSIVEDISERLPCKTCDACITQADVAGGTYTISSPGVYCVAENLTGTGGTPVINITSGYVTLDLCGHTITGGATSAGTYGVHINHGSDNGHVHVKNGGVTHAEAGVYVATGITDWTIEDIHAAATTTLPLTYGIWVFNANNGTIKSCRAYSCSTDGILIGNAGTNANILLLNCEARDTQGTGSNEGGFAIYADTDSSVIFKNCVSANGQQHGFVINGCGNVLFKDCISTNNALNGFILTNDVTRCILKGCISIGDVLGFSATVGDTGSITFKDCCFATQFSSLYINSKTDNICIADSIAIAGTNYGFYVRNTTDGVRTIIRNCAALGSENANGFNVTNGSALIERCASRGFDLGFYVNGEIDSIIRDCSALSFAVAGFRYGNQTTHPTTAGIIKNCLAVVDRDTVSGSNYGFRADTTAPLLIESCAALSNNVAGSYGFDIDPLSPLVTLRGNTACSLDTGFNDQSGTAAFFNNLARGNTTNYTGINTTMPPLPGAGSYFVANADGTSVGTPPNPLAMADTTGYWANIADPS